MPGGFPDVQLARIKVQFRLFGGINPPTFHWSRRLTGGKHNSNRNERIELTNSFVEDGDKLGLVFDSKGMKMTTYLPTHNHSQHKQHNQCDANPSSLP